MKDLDTIRHLVGNISPEQMVYVDSAVSATVGVFMPVAGQCQYAVTPEHTHPSWSFVVAFDGYCTVNFGGRIYHSEPSTVCVTPPLVPHQELPSAVVSRYIAVMIDSSYFETQLATYHRSTDEFPCGMTCPINQRLVDTLKEFMTDYEEAAPGYRHLLDAGALKITHLLIRLLLNLSPPNEKIMGRMSVNKAIEYLNTHYGEKIAVADLANVAYLSPSHFTRVFREETGMSPVDYIMQTRLDSAKRMLRNNDKTISAIALDCGFNSSSYFYQCFTRTFNLSPSDYRKSLSIAD